jgi:signal peptidase I
MVNDPPAEGTATAPRRKRKSTLREYAEAILFAVVITFVIRSFIIQAFRIPTGSMKDTLLVGDFLFVNKFLYGAPIPFTDEQLPALRNPKPGDIIVFKYPRDPKRDFIKRCIAIEGQTVEVREGQVFVDGQPEGKLEFLQRVYDSEENREMSYFRVTRPDGRTYVIRRADERFQNNMPYGPKVVPSGQLFMMGDNRDNSEDSRRWGFLDRRLIKGRAMFIYWSWDHEKTLPRVSRLLDIIH